MVVEFPTDGGTQFISTNDICRTLVAPEFHGRLNAGDPLTTHHVISRRRSRSREQLRRRSRWTRLRWSRRWVLHRSSSTAPNLTELHRARRLSIVRAACGRVRYGPVLLMMPLDRLGDPNDGLTTDCSDRRQRWAPSFTRAKGRWCANPSTRRSPTSTHPSISRIRSSRRLTGRIHQGTSDADGTT